MSQHFECKKFFNDDLVDHTTDSIGQFQFGKRGKNAHLNLVAPNKLGKLWAMYTFVNKVAWTDRAILVCFIFLLFGPSVSVRSTFVTFSKIIKSLKPYSSKFCPEPK